MTNDVAIRIAKRHNEACGQALSGGKLVFGPEGTGGEWYSGSTFGFVGPLIVYPVHPEPVTAEQVQEWLDETEAAAR